MRTFLISCFALLVLVGTAVSDEILHWTKLKDYLPDTFYKLEPSRQIQGTTISNKQMQSSTASLEYGTGDIRAKVTFTQSSMLGIQGAMMLENVPEVDSSEQILKKVKFGEVLAVATYTYADKLLEVTTFLPNKVMVTIAIENCPSLEEGVEACKAVDYEGLGNL